MLFLICCDTKLLPVLIVLISFIAQHLSLCTSIDEIKIGVLIRHRGLEEPLNKTLEMLNADTSILKNTRLVAIVEVLVTENSYQTSSAVCRLLAQDVWAIIGPQSIQLTPIIQSITSFYHIPLVLMNWQPYSYYNRNYGPSDQGMAGDTIRSSSVNRARRTSNLDFEHQYDSVPGLLNYTINLFPQADELSQAYLDLIRYKGWKSFSLIYDSSQDFVLVKDIFETSFSDTNINIEKINLSNGLLDIGDDHVEHDQSNRPQSGDVASGTLHTNDIIDTNDSDTNSQFDSTQSEYCTFHNESSNLAYRKLMKNLRKRDVENIVLSMPLDKVCKLLKEANSFGLLTIYNDYIIANLDTHLLNLTHLQPVMSNISGLSILDPDGQQMDVTPSRSWLGKRPAELPKQLLSTEYSMMSDAVSLLAYSLDEFLGENRPLTSPGVDCASREHWVHGEQLMDVLKRSVRHGGYTGDLKFDKFGQRINFNLEFILHKNNTFKKVGTWNIDNRLEDKTKQVDDFGFQAIKNKTLKVTVARTSPYVMYRDNYTDFTGNDRYQGYCIDLLNKLAKKLQFNYVIKEVSDGQYGKILNGSWTGMVRELLDWQADLAIVDLTITKERQSAVDFTHPFMTLGIAIMYKKPKMEEAEMYSFLMPFSKQVWLSMWSAYVAISLTLWLVSRLSPVEWHNPHPCFDDERELENEIHSISASLWFTIGSLMQQGSDLAPRAPSVRALASVWYFFTLILISSYTANFAAFLTASRMQSPIESAEDLSKQTKIDYGCKEGGSTQAFFATSNHSTYRRMWNFMDSRKHQGVFPESNHKGISMVKKGNFAFLMESTSIDYMVQRDCELTQIGGLLDHKGYGIALRKRSPFRAPLSKSIVELNEGGELQDLKNKWWLSERPACEEQKDSALATSELGIDKVGGVFVMLGVGVGLAFVASILEFVWKSLKSSKDQRDAIKTMLWREVLRIFRCGTSKRPATQSASDRSNSHPSMTNLNESASATSLNNRQGIGGVYGTKLGPISVSPINNGSVNQSVNSYGNNSILYDKDGAGQVYQTNEGLERTRQTRSEMDQE